MKFHTTRRHRAMVDRMATARRVSLAQIAREAFEPGIEALYRKFAGAGR